MSLKDGQFDGGCRPPDKLTGAQYQEQKFIIFYCGCIIVAAVVGFLTVSREKRFTLLGITVVVDVCLVALAKLIVYRAEREKRERVNRRDGSFKPIE